MMIREIAISLGDATACPSAHIEVEGKEYLLIGSALNASVTVIAGRQWINSRRTLGRTYWNARELLAAYKQHGALLLEYATRLTTFAR